MASTGNSVRSQPRPTPPSSRLGALTTLCSRSNAWRPIAGFLKPPQLYPPGTPVSEMDTDMNDPLNIFIGEAQYIDAVRPPIICPTTLDWLTHTCASVVGWQDRLAVYLWCGRGRDPIGLPCGHLRTQTLHHHLRPRLLHRSFDPGVRGRGAQVRGSGRLQRSGHDGGSARAGEQDESASTHMPRAPARSVCSFS